MGEIVRGIERDELVRLRPGIQPDQSTPPTLHEPVVLVS
jgi:hypothetical protein